MLHSPNHQGPPENAPTNSLAVAFESRPRSWSQNVLTTLKGDPKDEMERFASRVKARVACAKDVVLEVGEKMWGYMMQIQHDTSAVFFEKQARLWWLALFSDVLQLDANHWCKHGSRWNEVTFSHTLNINIFPVCLHCHGIYQVKVNAEPPPIEDSVDSLLHTL